MAAVAPVVCADVSAAAASQACDGCLAAWKLGLEATGAFIALGAFIVGLLQYRRAQQWKRAEFLATELKPFFQDAKVSAAFTMIDWAERDINLSVFTDPKNTALTRVTLRMQCRALEPHDLEGSATRPAASSGDSSDGGTHSFSEAETAIRDCYDALLDGLDRLGSYLEAGLISAHDVRPYIGYWINDIAKPTKDPDYALWCVCFLTYVYYYHFDGVPILFRALNHDIRPDGEIFEGFVQGVKQQDDRALASKLQAAAIKGYEEGLQNMSANQRLCQPCSLWREKRATGQSRRSKLVGSM
jgi:hypothetical protein